MLVLAMQPGHSGGADTAGVPVREMNRRAAVRTAFVPGSVATVPVLQQDDYTIGSGWLTDSYDMTAMPCAVSMYSLTLTTTFSRTSSRK